MATFRVRSRTNVSTQHVSRALRASTPMKLLTKKSALLKNKKALRQYEEAVAHADAAFKPLREAAARSERLTARDYGVRINAQ